MIARKAAELADLERQRTAKAAALNALNAELAAKHNQIKELQRATEQSAQLNSDWVKKVSVLPRPCPRPRPRPRPQLTAASCAHITR